MTSHSQPASQAGQQHRNPFHGRAGNGSRRPETCPRLLVSVRSAVEVPRAIEGGADILDVKEPSRGSLGMASIDELNAIAAAIQIHSSEIPLSVALGEMTDWNSAADLPLLPPGLTFAKLGMQGCAADSNWQRDWQQLRQRFQQRSPSRINWVAVAYADADAAASPPLLDIVTAAIESQCAGLLIDTWSKQHGSLLDQIDLPTISSVAKHCHASGLFVAVAGKLSLDSLAALRHAPIDIVAVRSAACIGTDRTAELDANRIAAFRSELRLSWAT